PVGHPGEPAGSERGTAPGSAPAGGADAVGGGHQGDGEALAGGSRAVDSRPGEAVATEPRRAGASDVLPGSPAPDEAAEGVAPSGRHERSRKAHKGGFWRELPVLLGVALVLALLIKAFLVQAFYIPSGSMMNTLQIDDRVLVNKLVYRARDVHRGEVIVFKGPEGWAPEYTPPEPAQGIEKVTRFISGLVVGVHGEKDFIKRVIALPGDRVACCTDGKVTVTPKGSTTPVQLQEPYVFSDPGAVQTPFCAKGDNEQTCPAGSEGVLVPEGRLWVMGDHRDQSSDSRYHRQFDDGTIPVDDVIGRAFVIVWPVSRATVLRVPGTFDQRALGLAAQGAPLVAGLALALPVTALRRRRRRVRS
ncbi:MAG: signal peptidase, partial [Frankiales bacterium]|nr:signal peptidase [Frankiales bacterium]